MRYGRLRRRQQPGGMPGGQQLAKVLLDLYQGSIVSILRQWSGIATILRVRLQARNQLTVMKRNMRLLGRISCDAMLSSAQRRLDNASSTNTFIPKDWATKQSTGIQNLLRSGVVSDTTYKLDKRSGEARYSGHHIPLSRRHPILLITTSTSLTHLLYVDPLPLK